MAYANRFVFMKTAYHRHIANFPNLLKTTIKWLLLIAIIATATGSASAFFLTALQWCTNLREHNLWIIMLLPIGGLGIGLLYHHYGTDVVKGNNLLLDELQLPQKPIPFKMAPLVLIGTLITHLFGGSAGREGTAVQMGGAIADRLAKPFRLNAEDRKILILMGISGGFASVFGTPIAGAVFALELMVLRKIKLQWLLPTFLTAFASDFICGAWHVNHIRYEIPNVPDFSAMTIVWAAVAGIFFGIAAMLFTRTTSIITRLFGFMKYPPLRPFVGGIVLVAAFFLIGNTNYHGLGIPIILEAFKNPVAHYAFALKILLTAVTLGSGFKGGEVTPLFFIGAVLGNALFGFIPLPLALLAGMGLAAVFSGATHTPLTCSFLGLELFGIASVPYIAIACFVAYVFSGSSGIYSSQDTSHKHRFYRKLQNLQNL